tara:strand:+ start:391 stop:1092 length:702 start_codon:yes stop_codon:yes gene_type:complete
MNSSLAIEITGINKSFGRKELFRNLNFSVKWGEAIVVIGSNGSGKTTLISLIATLAAVDSGSIIVSGLDVSRDPEQIRSNIGFIAHETLLYDELSGYENLQFVGRMYGITDIDRKVMSVAVQLGLEDRINERISTLSHGLKKRFSIARALIHEPRILLMDEPEAGLDSATVDILGDIVRKHSASGGASVITTHSLQGITKIADRIAKLSSNGSLIEESINGYVNNNDEIVNRS